MKPRILLISDVRGWAFDTNMHDLAAELGHRFDFSHFYVADWLDGARPRWADFDLLVECYHRNPPMGLPLGRTVGALRSQWFTTERPAPPTDEDVALVNRYCAFHVALEAPFRALDGRCPRAEYLTNPVDVRRFAVVGRLSRVIAEWNGNAGHSAGSRLIKHFDDVVVPACQRAGVPLVVAEYGTATGPHRRRTPEEMPDLYREANVALCASEFEAASNSVMEAMASGLALIATDVGNHRQLRDSQIATWGDTGVVLVDGTVDAFVEALRALTPERARAMGVLNRAEIAARWSWGAWADRYERFLEKALHAAS